MHFIQVLAEIAGHSTEFKFQMKQKTCEALMTSQQASDQKCADFCYLFSSAAFIDLKAAFDVLHRGIISGQLAGSDCLD